MIAIDFLVLHFCQLSLSKNHLLDHDAESNDLPLIYFGSFGAIVNFQHFLQ